MLRSKDNVSIIFNQSTFVRYCREPIITSRGYLEVAGSISLLRSYIKNDILFNWEHEIFLISMEKGDIRFKVHFRLVRAWGKEVRVG